MYSINDKVVFREVGENIVLINLNTGYYYSFNGLGSLIFNSLVKKMDIDQILREIVGNFDIAREGAEKDLKEFLDKLEKEDILKVN